MSRTQIKAVSDIRPKRIARTDTAVHQAVQDHEDRLCVIEDTHSVVTDIQDTINKLSRYLKLVGPALIGAAVSAGVVNGKVGAFLNALFTGTIPH